MLPHHPTPAQLADFRQALSPSKHPHRFDHAVRAHERREGIGHTVGPRGNVIFRASDPSTEARREAGAMRSRAFATRGFMLPNVCEAPGHPPMVQDTPGGGLRQPGDRIYTAAWPDELALGVPAWGWPLAGEPCRDDLNCGTRCYQDDDNGFVYEGQRGGNGYAVEDVQFECWCEHHGKRR